MFSFGAIDLYEINSLRLLKASSKILTLSIDPSAINANDIQLPLSDPLAMCPWVFTAVYRSISVYVFGKCSAGGSRNVEP